MIVSQSANRDRVVVYRPFDGSASSYRPLHDAKVRSTSVWGRYVSVVAVGPGTAQFAVYDIGFKKWAIQELLGEMNAGNVDASLPNGDIPILAPRFDAADLTQLAVFDFKRFRWAVQDLVEPWHAENVRPFTNRNQAVYVLGRHVYAYTAEAGRWDRLSLEKPLLAKWAANVIPPPHASGLSVNENSVAVSQGGLLHIFAAKTGRWQRSIRRIER